MGLSWDKPSTNWCRISSIQYLMIVDDSESCVCVGVDDAVVEVGPRCAVCTCLTSLFKEGTVGFSQFCSDDQALCWWFQSLTSCFAPMRNSCPGDLVFVMFLLCSITYDWPYHWPSFQMMDGPKVHTRSSQTGTEGLARGAPVGPRISFQGPGHHRIHRIHRIHRHLDCCCFPSFGISIFLNLPKFRLGDGSEFSMAGVFPFNY